MFVNIQPLPCGAPGFPSTSELANTHGDGFMFGGTMLEPTNEMGVIVVFSQACETRGWEIVFIQSAFPDAVIRNKATGAEYRVEFEYNAASFQSHGHDPRECDLIVCWTNDIRDFPMTVWELRNWDTDDIVLLPEADKEILHLRMENKRLRNELVRTRNELRTAQISNRSSAPSGEGRRMQILELWHKQPDTPHAQIAEVVGVSRQYVDKVISKNGYSK